MAIVKLTRLDLDYILTQIQMAEDGQVPVNPLLSFGLREVRASNNNLSPGRQHCSARPLQCLPGAHRSDVQTAQSRHELRADQRVGRRIQRRVPSA